MRSASKVIAPSDGSRVPGPMAPLLGRLPGEARRGHVHLVGPVGDPVLGEDQTEGPEGGGLHCVDAGGEVLAVHLADEIGAGEDEVLVAALEVGTAEIVGAEITALDPGAEGAVEDQDALGQGGEEIRHGAEQVTGPAGSSFP